MPTCLQGRKHCAFIHDRLTTQCEKRNHPDLRELSQLNLLRNISMKELDAAKSLLTLSKQDLYMYNQTQEYDPSSGECLEICSTHQYCSLNKDCKNKMFVSYILD